MSEEKDGLGGKGGKFSAQAVLGHTERAEGLLAPKPDEKREAVGRPAVKSEKLRKARKYYLNDREWEEFLRWCGSEDASKMVRLILKRAMHDRQGFGGFRPF